MSGPGDEEGEDAGYDEWLEAVREDDGYYLACENDHGLLPPRRVCPHCGSRDLTEESLPDVGEIQTFTVTHVATPNFADDTPYVTAIAQFGGVSFTGQVRGVDVDDVEVGMTVGVSIEESETTDEAVVVFRPR